MKPILFLLIGYPGSGKSTWIEASGLPSVKWEWKQAWEDVDGQFQAQLRLGDSFAFECCNMREGRRAYFVRTARAAGFQVHGVWLDTPLGICVRSRHWRMLREYQGEFDRPAAREFDVLDVVRWWQPATVEAP